MWELAGSVMDSETTAIGVTVVLENGLEIRDSWISASRLRPCYVPYGKSVHARFLSFLYASHACLPFWFLSVAPRVSSLVLYPPRTPSSFFSPVVFSLSLCTHLKEFNHLEVDIIGRASN